MTASHILHYIAATAICAAVAIALLAGFILTHYNLTH